ncbi:MAG TPA: TIGR03118 family protein, partial [Candidatus Limnocylindrales bacterium]
MRDRRPLLGLLLAAAALVLAACGGGTGDAGSTPPPGTTTPPPTSTVPAATAYSIGKLVADSNAGGAAHVDANLVNAWGVAFNPTAFVWVADRGSNKSTLYDGNGVAQAPVVAIPASPGAASSPTGIVFNGGTGFRISQGGASGTSLFLFAGAGGTISAWSPNVNFTNAVLVVDDSPAGTIYTGLAITGAGDRLFAADFRHGTVNVFDGGFARVATAAGAFTDQTLPAGYAPYGI